MKKWKDTNDAIKMVHNLDSEKLRRLDREMTKKPNFDKWNKKEEKSLKM